MTVVVLLHFLKGNRCKTVDIRTGIQHQIVLPNERPVVGIGVAVDVTEQHVASGHVRPGHHGVMAERHLPLAVTNEVQVIHALEEVFEVALLDPVPVVVSDDEVLFALELLQVLFGRLLVSEQQVAKNIDGIAVGNLGIPVSD